MSFFPSYSFVRDKVLTKSLSPAELYHTHFPWPLTIDHFLTAHITVVCS